MNILKEIKKIAFFINGDAENVRLEASKLANDFGNYFENPSHQLNIDDVDLRYTNNQGMYISNDTQSGQGFKQIAATGAVPVDDKIKIKLVMIENLYPKISESYTKFKYVDEVWYLDRQSVGGGNTHINILSRVVPGFDIGGEYERGERPYSRFGIIGPEHNPERKSLWSPNALIEIFDEFVISAQAPVYVKNEFIGKISIHYNLILLRSETVAKSNSNLLLISNQFTLIGMSPSAREITNFTEYNKKPWDSKKAKMEYLNTELNLLKQHKDFANALKGLTPGKAGECEFSGKKYKIYKEEVPEVGFQVVALQ